MVSSNNVTITEQGHLIVGNIGVPAVAVPALRAHFAAEQPTTPRTVTTVEELNWLPPGSIVRWKSGIAGQRDEFDRFKSTNGNLQPIRHCGMFLPATVLYVPSEGVES